MPQGRSLWSQARLTRRQLIAFALASAALNGLITASVGAWLAQTYSVHQSRRQSIETISNLLYERRTRAGMVASAIRRNADLDEIRQRKRAYDDAYVAWNTQALRHLFVIRDIMGDGAAGQASIEQEFQDILVGAMADVDRCITKAVDARAGGGDGVAILAGCKMADLHQFVLDCGASFLNELDKLTRLSFLPFAGNTAAGKAKAETRIRKGCAPPATAKAGSTPAPPAAPATPQGPAAANEPAPPSPPVPASETAAPAQVSPPPPPVTPPGAPGAP